MRLVKLHIINFGKLSDYSYEFDNELNSFVFDNGWGKTTLSNFILAMLYGFNGNGKGINNNLRRKYNPWNNGTYGGSLEINHDGKEYLIERTFGSSSKNDTFILYDLKTNKPVSDYTTNIGQEILDLDYESFERSIYIPQNDLELGFNETLKSKLANVIGGTNDVQNYESAINILATKYKIIKKNSKAGAVFDKKMELEELEKEITITKSNIDAIDVIKNEIANIEKELVSLKDSRTKALNDIKLMNEYNAYKKALEQLNYFNNELDELKKELETKKNNLNDLNILEINKKKQKIKEYDSLMVEKDVLRKTALNNKVDDIISTDELTELEEKVLSYDKVKKHNNILGLFLGVSLVIIIVGIIIFLSDRVIGGIIAGTGLISMICFSVIFTKGKNKKKELLDNISFILRKNELDFIDINTGLNYLRVRKKEQMKSLESKVKDNEKINELELNINELYNELNEFFSRYKLVSLDFNSKVNELERYLSDISILSNTIKAKQDYIDKFIIDNKLDIVKEEVEGDFESLQEIHNQVNNRISFLEQELAKQLTKLNMYEENVLKLDSLTEEKERIINTINEMEKEYNLLTLTESYLKKSQDSLLAKYVKPMKDRLNKYLSIVSNKNFYIDTNFNFTYEENGIRREIDYYSKGIQQLIVLCMRFSLMDCLFKENKPFIILDDSFVDFDENNLNIIKEIINYLKKEYQIIYFTCHESRVMD